MRNKTTIIFRGPNISSSCCGCNSGNEGIDLPSGGVDGNVLAKNGNNLIWIDPTTLSSISTVDTFIPISSNGQVNFLNAIPEGHSLVSLIIGIKHELDEDYTVSGRNILWIGEEELEIGDILIITTQNSIA